MKPYRLLTVLSLSLLFILSGCRVVLVDETLEQAEAEPEPKGKEPISLQSKVQFSTNKLVFRGETDLPKGAVIEASLTEYPETVTLQQVMNAEAEPLAETKVSETGEIGEDGTFLIVMKRSDPQKRYQVSVQFRPELQPQAVKDLYGETGEYIGGGEGFFEYEAGQTEYKGIALFAPLPNLNDGGFYQGKWDMHENQEKARPSF
ncbi:hypothetical protein [Rossellomorea aquimaris]|uniref:Lipoprotein n=1 Tax=Rossellomorea aquimaris TaxID=189382 RepID=A0A1J6VWE9_9BACI|nr:hypothetical protein [Rossellomorea aquimaris]OIU69613.1 hypothetical protein BHE18_01435 [Rossellomorea aquimaris]